MRTCDEIRDALLQGVPLDDVNSHHIEQCGECSDFQVALRTVDASLSDLSDIQIPEALIFETLQRIDMADEKANSFVMLITQLIARLVAGFVMVLSVAFRPWRYLRIRKTAWIGIPAFLGLLLVIFVFSPMKMSDSPSVAAGVNGRADQLFEETEEFPSSTVSVADVRTQERMAPAEQARDAWDQGGGENGLDPENIDISAVGKFSSIELNWREDETREGETPPNDETITRSEFRDKVDTLGNELRQGFRVSRRAPTQRVELQDFEQDGDYGGFVRNEQSLDGVSFLPAQGMWSNTYIPGDSRIRLLSRRLRQIERELHPGFGESAYQLAQHAFPITHRLTAPEREALSLSLHTDHKRIEGRSRLLLQVGLRARDNYQGRRPTLRSMVVLDLRRELSAAQQAQIRSFFLSLVRMKRSGDQIGVVVVGPRGGMKIEPGSLRFGQVQVMLRRLFDESKETENAPMSLEEAFSAAMESASLLNDEEGALGSRLVWFLTPEVNAGDEEVLQSIAHLGVLAGVTTTSVGFDQAQRSALDRIALAGHGRRWIADDNMDEIVRDELRAVSQIVARALRIQIRLAQDVQLVDIIGSRRLDDREAHRVRSAEQALDRQLAQRLGIRADRNQDNDGIQIVVPAFYAGDTHTILLDVVVDGPGAVADVSLRYKDLIRLGNGSASERVVLTQGSNERGPQEREVRRDFLIKKLSLSLERIAHALSRGQTETARAELERAKRGFEQEASLYITRRADRELSRSVELLQRIELAMSGSFSALELADSLRLASHRLIFGDPLALLD